MFTKALESAGRYTLPVVVSKRFLSGQVEAGCATFVVVNAEGWVLTAAHVLEDMVLAQRHAALLANYHAERARIEADARLNAKQRKRQLGRIQRDDWWITNHSYWWGADGRTTTDWAIDQLADLALARLQPFDASAVAEYPVFRSPTEPLIPGTSLCRLGFPFHAIQATFDAATGRFRLADGTLPMPRFPLDGILTRGAVFVDEASKRTAEFVETSTPGLRGQSGGPLLDVKGRVCGLQSRTLHLPLGFSPTVRVGTREVQENQFLNVGLAAHVKEVTRFLAQQGVKYEVV